MSPTNASSSLILAALSELWPASCRSARACGECDSQEDLWLAYIACHGQPSASRHIVVVHSGFVRHVPSHGSKPFRLLYVLQFQHSQADQGLQLLPPGPPKKALTDRTLLCRSSLEFYAGINDGNYFCRKHVLHFRLWHMLIAGLDRILRAENGGRTLNIGQQRQR